MTVRPKLPLVAEDGLAKGTATATEVNTNTEANAHIHGGFHTIVGRKRNGVRKHCRKRSMHQAKEYTEQVNSKEGQRKEGGRGRKGVHA